MNLLRDLLLLGIVACVVTMLASAAAWWGQEPKRLRRALRRALGGRPDAELICYGRGVALDLHRGLAATAWGRGAATVHDLERLTGMELLVDGQVAARVVRDAERKALDRIVREAQEVVLRLVFDDAHDPDFQIWMWRVEDSAALGSPMAAIDEARRWLARGEAIMRAPNRTPPRVASDRARDAHDGEAGIVDDEEDAAPW